MSIKDLKTGMKVKLRDGSERIVLLNAYHEWDKTTDFLVESKRNTGWFSLNSYSDDLTHKGFAKYDIIDVFEPDHLKGLISNPEEIVWKGQAKEMTLDEIEKALGYKVKIVG